MEGLNDCRLKRFEIYPYESIVNPLPSKVPAQVTEVCNE